MTRASKALIVVIVASLGLWGCTKGPTNLPTAQVERLHALEGKCAKLEDDYRAVASARDQSRKRVTALEEERAQLLKEVAVKAALLKEREELRNQIEARIGERNALQDRCDRLKKGLQNLLGQDDAMAPAPTPPVTSTVKVTPGKS
jgi:hypothetical protein